MKSRFIVLAPILGATVFVGANAQAACNARQEFCTYPTWAANSFSSQGGQKPRFASGYPESYLAPDITDYGYGPVFAYAPTYGSASAYGYGPAYGYVLPYRSVAGCDEPAKFPIIAVPTRRNTERPGRLRSGSVREPQLKERNSLCV